MNNIVNIVLGVAVFILWLLMTIAALAINMDIDINKKWNEIFKKGGRDD